MFNGVIVKNLVAIGLVIGLGFASQLAYFKNNSQVFTLGPHTGAQQVNAYSGGNFLSKIGDWIKTNVYPKVSGEVANRTTVASGEVTNQVATAKQNSVDVAKKFVAQKILDALGVKPQDLQQCKP